MAVTPETGRWDALFADRTRGDVGEGIAFVLGFLAAFAVSFVGHRRWSFPAEGRPVAPALRRFAVVAVSGFALNESAYAVLLRSTQLDYRVALFIVLVAVAGLTWLAGRYWAFTHRP